MSGRLGAAKEVHLRRDLPRLAIVLPAARSRRRTARPDEAILLADQRDEAVDRIGSLAVHRAGQHLEMVRQPEIVVAEVGNDLAARLPDPFVVRG